MTDAAQPIRPAATVILWRRADDGVRVLMGMRGAQSVFMPSKYVFPGGAVDPGDHDGAPVSLSAQCEARLRLNCLPDAPPPQALARAALRELAEETGLTFAQTGPDLRFVFRAITPAGRPRRFDARFFMVDADLLAGDPDDFAAASDELSHLHWIGLGQARDLDLPFITEVVLAEVTSLLNGGPDHGVPFFDNSGVIPAFRRLI